MMMRIIDDSGHIEFDGTHSVMDRVIVVRNANIYMRTHCRITMHFTGEKLPETVKVSASVCHRFTRQQTTRDGATTAV